MTKTILTGARANFENSDYLKLFGIKKESASAKEIWQTIIKHHLKCSSETLKRFMPELNIILDEGTLSERILKSLDGNLSLENLQKVYKRLAFCLDENKMFHV